MTRDDDTAGAFCREFGLPAEFADDTRRSLDPLAAMLRAAARDRGRLLVGLSGAQGTGKTTAAAYLQRVLGRCRPGGAVALSLDDFYLPLAARRRLAREVHPLLATRGVPGTHDLGLLDRTLHSLFADAAGRPVSVPVFDKSADDRAPPGAWRQAAAPAHIVILEGWCLGCPAQDDDELRAPVNELEAECDGDGTWRRYVNAQLAGPYARLFAGFDLLVFLRAPGLSSVADWRGEQEARLAASDAAGGRIMSQDALRRFMAHFQRLTEVCLQRLPAIADIVIDVDEAHRYAPPRVR